MVIIFAFHQLESMPNLFFYYVNAFIMPIIFPLGPQTLKYLLSGPLQKKLADH